MNDKIPPIEQLKHVMKRLRDPETGCPWDKEQTFQSIVPYTIEEAYEVVDAIERNDMKDLEDELGDLLLQVIYHAEMASEKGHFTFDDVAQGVADKMIYRHPHVFGDADAENADDVDSIWDQQKSAEKDNKGALDGVTRGLPALLRAQKLQKKAAKTGFEWSDTEGAFDKVEEEIAEFKEATEDAHIEEELGDLLFCIVNYARMNGFNSEEALRKANDKFTERFKEMEATCAQDNKQLSDLTLPEMLECWSKQKKSA